MMYVNSHRGQSFSQEKVWNRVIHLLQKTGKERSSEESKKS